jgi:hypothetical protein
MDDTMKVEFPLGNRSVIMSRPSEGQLLAITILRMPKEGDEPAVKHRFLQRIIRFLEVLAGAGQWQEIEDGLLAEEIEPGDLLTLFSDVTQFDWAGQAATPETHHVAETIPEPERRAPRVVSGG